MVCSEEEARPIVGLFKCSWLNIGPNLAGGCGVRTGELGVSMRLIGLRKVGLLQSQGLLGLPL
jgi:hypothetical protein